MIKGCSDLFKKSTFNLENHNIFHNSKKHHPKQSLLLNGWGRTDDRCLLKTDVSHICEKVDVSRVTVKMRDKKMKRKKETSIIYVKSC